MRDLTDLTIAHCRRGLSLEQARRAVARQTCGTTPAARPSVAFLRAHYLSEGRGELVSTEWAVRVGRLEHDIGASVAEHYQAHGVPLPVALSLGRSRACHLLGIERDAFAGLPVDDEPTPTPAPLAPASSPRPPRLPLARRPRRRA